MNEFMKQAFSCCEVLQGELTEVLQTFEDGCAFCKVSVTSGGYDFLVNVELNEFAKKPCKVGDAIQFKLALMYTDHGEVYKDEDEFFGGQYGKAYAPESFVPNTDYDEDGAHEDSSAFVIGKVLSMEEVTLCGDLFAHIKLSCLGCELDLFAEANGLPKIEIGNIVCGLFDTIGLTF